MISRAERPDVRLGNTQAIRLVAEREVRTRLRSKTYRIMTLVLVVLVIGFALIMKVISSLDAEEKVGFTSATAAMAPHLESIAKGMGEDVDSEQVTEQDGRQRVADGTLDALVLGTAGPRLQVLVDEELDGDLRGPLTAAAGQATLDGRITELGGDPAAVAAEVGRASVDVTALDPSQTFDPERLAVGSVAGIVIYLALITTGQSVAQGVVEEKSSRVVELLLATIHPWQLMAGKVLGIGLVGLLQVAAVGIAGAVAGRFTGTLSLSVPTTVGVVAWLIVWFVLGFALYSLVFAGLGALVSRQEDVGGVTTPATMLLVVGYVVGISVLPSAPDNPIVAGLSLVPVFSPTLMPMRLAMGGVPLWQTLVSLGLAVATLPLLVALAGRIYRNGVVRTGARLRLREALRTG
ncbi:MAG TPA: ABC transporter permease [Nocardioidaceae bacterium]|nr:ABC transporter permease [Nocardioidaceae bacterium]